MSRKAFELTGKKFSRFTVIKRHDSSNKKCVLWLCVCDCGNERILTTSALTGMRRKSCGCLCRDRMRTLDPNNNHRNTRLYSIYTNMKTRCYQPNCPIWGHYGGRGIYMCHKWKISFMEFHRWAMENGYSTNKSLDRIDANKNYEPNNCRWATRTEQARNVSGLRKDNTSGYVGVTLRKGKWMASTSINNKRYRIGTFSTAIEAAEAYDDYLRANVPEKSFLNFPNRQPERNCDERSTATNKTTSDTATNKDSRSATNNAAF